MGLRDLIHKLAHRPIKSPEHYWRVHAMAGEINEFFKRQVISIDDNKYTLPFLCNPFKWRDEAKRWLNTESMEYEFQEDDEAREEAGKRFESIWNLIDGRLKKEWSILDVGCNAGYFLDKFHEKGFTKLHGIDLQKTAVDYAHKHRPYLDIRHGGFGLPENDIVCDVVIMFKSVYRIPYQDRVFDAFDRCAKKYIIFEAAPEMQYFHRDLHVGLYKKGFMCIEKHVTTLDFKPIGIDDTLMNLNPPQGVEPDPFFANYIFRRIEPRD